MRIRLDGRRKTVLIVDLDEDALVLAHARLQWWIEMKRERGSAPSEESQARFVRREYRKILARRLDP